MKNRLLRAIEAGRRATAARDGASPGPDVMRSSVALLLMGPAGEDIEVRALEHVEVARRASAIPLLITSFTDVMAIGVPGLVYEYLPTTSDVLESTEELPDIALLYVLRRLELIFDKWLVVECRWSGQEAQELVSLRMQRPELARSRIRFAPLR